MTRAERFRPVAAAVLVVCAVLSACSGGGGGSGLTAVSTDSGLAPKSNGFSFANFGSAASPEVFDQEDLVTMFGSSACADGKADPCTPTAQAAQWAQMVNESRASGHCEGLAVQSASRFTSSASPATVELRNEGEVTKGIMRAFATQFFPEVQSATNSWAKKSLNEILNELGRALAAKDVSYTLGLYTPAGGHAVLPYALEIDDQAAVIKVYDSNWPGMDRYVVIDRKTDTWYFSFSAADPQKDECAWTGRAGDMDITPMAPRTEALCPFCGDDSKVAKNVLVIRSASLDWSLKTDKGTFSPADGTAVADVRARAIRTATCEQSARIPEYLVYTETRNFALDLPDTSSVYVSTGDAVVRVVTQGKKKRNPVVFGDKSVATEDPSTRLTVAADNVVAQIELAQADVTIGENLVSIGTGDAEVKADEGTPQIIVTDNGGTAPPTVTETEKLVTVVPEVPKELVPDPVKPGLTPASERDLSNEAYATFVETAPVRNAVIPPTATTTTITTVPAAATTVKPSTGSATTTTVKGATTTTVAGGSTGTGTGTGTGTTSPPGTATGTGGNATTTTVRSTTTVPATTTTPPVQMATFKVVVNGSNPNLQVDIGWSDQSWDQNWNRWTCNGSGGCQNATRSVPLNDYVFVRVLNAYGGYVNFGIGFGGSFIQSNDMYFPPTDQRRCGPDWAGWSNNTCTFTIDL